MSILTSICNRVGLKAEITSLPARHVANEITGKTKLCIFRLFLSRVCLFSQLSFKTTYVEYHARSSSLFRIRGDNYLFIFVKNSKRTENISCIWSNINRKIFFIGQRKHNEDISQDVFYYPHIFHVTYFYTSSHYAFSLAVIQ